jgi:hypothetical protein
MMNKKKNKHLDQQAEGKGGIWNHGFSGDIISIQGLPHIDSRNQESHGLPFSHSGTPFSHSASILTQKNMYQT